MRDFKIVQVLGCLVIAACEQAGDGTSQRRVESNELGIQTIEVQRTIDGADRVTLLRGLGADGVEIAGATVRVGAVRYTPDPDRYPPFSTFGRELSVWLGEQHAPPFTVQNLDAVNVPELWSGPMAEFMRLADVRAIVGADAMLTFTQRSGEAAYAAFSCDHTKQSGSSQSCCQMSDGGQWGRNAQNFLVQRLVGDACRTASGGSCTGAGCAYGPCGGWILSQTSPGPDTVKVYYSTTNSNVCGRQDGWGNHEPQGEPWTNQTQWAGVTGSCTALDCCDGEPTWNPYGCEGGQCGGGCDENWPCTENNGYCDNGTCLCTE